MEEKKEYCHGNSGIKMSSELSEEEKKHLSEIGGSGFQESVRTSLLLEKIIILSKRIKEFNKSSDNYSEKIVYLTWVLVFLTFVLAIPLIVSFIGFIIKSFN